MTKKALSLLKNHKEGFFMMVEGARIDHACHAVELKKMIYETKEFSKTVQVVIDWAKKNSPQNTLILVTADHETGGLKIIKAKRKGQLPTVKWEKAYKSAHGYSAGHSSAEVPIYGWGKNSHLIKEKMDNTDIFKIFLEE